MGRKKHNPADSLGRFMLGVYDYYHDRGMPQKTAKARMIDSTLEVCTNFMKEEDEVPDEMLVIMAQFMSKALNNRGAQMTKTIREIEKNAATDPRAMDTGKLLTPLHDIKKAKDAMDTFIETYKGWSEIHGTEEKS
jgi:hypothetical protein